MRTKYKHFEEEKEAQNVKETSLDEREVNLNIKVQMEKEIFKEKKMLTVNFSDNRDAGEESVSESEDEAIFKSNFNQSLFGSKEDSFAIFNTKMEDIDGKFQDFLNKYKSEASLMVFRGFRAPIIHKENIDILIADSLDRIMSGSINEKRVIIWNVDQLEKPLELNNLQIEQGRLDLYGPKSDPFLVIASEGILKTISFKDKSEKIFHKQACPILAVKVLRSRDRVVIINQELEMDILKLDFAKNVVKKTQIPKRQYLLDSKIIFISSNEDSSALIIGFYQLDQKIQFLKYTIDDDRYDFFFERKNKKESTRNLVFALSQDWNYYAQPERETILIWETQSDVLISKIHVSGLNINSLVFTVDSQFLIASGMRTSFSMWNIKQGELVFQDKQNTEFSHLSISEDSTIIADDSNNGVCVIKNDINEKVFYTDNLEDKKVKKVEVAMSSNKVYCLFQEGQIYVHNSKDLKLIENYSTPNIFSPFLPFFYYEKNGVFVVFQKDSKTLCSYDKTNDKLQEIYSFEKEVWACYFGIDELDELILVVVWENILKIIQVFPFSQREEYRLTMDIQKRVDFKISCSRFFERICVGFLSDIIWEIQTLYSEGDALAMSKPTFFELDLGNEILDVIFHPENPSEMLIATTKSLIYNYDIDMFEVRRTIGKKEKFVSNQAVCYANRGTLICLACKYGENSNCQIKIYDSNDGYLIKKLQTSFVNISSMLYYAEEARLICSGDGYFDVKEQVISSLNFARSRLYSFGLLSYLEFINIQLALIFLSKSEDYTKLLNLCSREDLKIWLHKSFIHHLNFTLLHFIVFTGRVKYAKILLEICKHHRIYPRITRDFKGKTPLDLAIDVGNIQIIEIVIEFYILNPPPLHSCSVSDNNIKDLLDLSVSVADLLESRYLTPYGDFPVIDSKLGDFFSSFNSGFRRLEEYNDMMKLKPEYLKKIELRAVNSEKNRGLSIIKKSKVKGKIERIKLIYPEIRILDIPNLISIESDFLEKAAELESDNKIFATRAFRALIDFKWSSFAYRNFLQDMIIFFIFALLYTVNGIFIFTPRVQKPDCPTGPLCIVSIIFDVVLLLYIFYLIPKEIRQIRVVKWERYKKSFWNFLDIFIIVFGFSTIVFDLVQVAAGISYMRFLKLMRALSTIFVLFKASNYLRGFESTAFMIRLVIRVVSDMKIFFVITSYFIISFACFLMIIQKDYKKTYEIFSYSYRMVLGDFDPYFDITASHGIILSIFFFVFTILMNIVMLNILIAIISKSYETVTNNEKLANAYERANLIVDYEKAMSREQRGRLNTEIKLYAFAAYSEPESRIEEDSSVNGPLKTLSILEKMEIKRNRAHHELLSKTQKLELDMKSLAHKMEFLEESIRMINIPQGLSQPTNPTQTSPTNPAIHKAKKNSVF